MFSKGTHLTSFGSLVFNDAGKQGNASVLFRFPFVINVFNINFSFCHTRWIVWSIQSYAFWYEKFVGLFPATY